MHRQSIRSPQRGYDTDREEEPMYIGIGTLVVIVLIVLVVMYVL